MAETPHPTLAAPSGPPQLPLIDPTKNVLDLVAAESRYRDAMRKSDADFQSAMREKDRLYQDAMRDAEVRRQDDLSRQRIEFDQLRDDLLRKQVAEMGGLQSERLSKLEQFRYESSGKVAGVVAVIGWIFAVAGFAVALASLGFKFHV